MDENSIFHKLREWLRGLLRILFTEDVLEQIGQAARGENEEAGPGLLPGEADRADTVRKADDHKANTANTDNSEEMTNHNWKENNTDGRGEGVTRERRHLRFFGRVQGVGFRYQLMNDARGHGLTGWVKNLPDGSVEAELQGSPEAIDFVIHNLGNGRWIRIEAIEADIISVDEEERSFHVRGY